MIKKFTESKKSKILNAIDIVGNDQAKRIDVDDSIKVYKAGTIVRVDIKVGE
ncbi:MAG: hypothetical protein ACOCRO_07290 [Halanaerobiales bacterium]